MDTADRSALVHIFADAMQIADDAAPALAAGMDGPSLGSLGIRLARPLRSLTERLDRVPEIEDIPSDTLESLKALARIIRETRTECIAYGDVALHLAQSKMKSVAHDGWQSLVRSKPQNQRLMAWADAPTPTRVELAVDTQESTSRSPALIKAGHTAQSDDEAEFRWTAPMLEGYVLAVLREVEYPTERDAVARIADMSRKREPSRATLRKTRSWQNRPQKTPKPSTTNEAQSGVSPAQNAYTGVSHEEVTNAVLDIEGKLHRQLVDNERDAVTWTLQNAGSDEEDRDEAIRQLIQGFRSGNM